MVDDPFKEEKNARLEKFQTGTICYSLNGLVVEPWWKGGGSGGGGFFLACEDFGRMFGNSCPACAFFFFFKVEISSCKLIPLFRPG